MSNPDWKYPGAPKRESKQPKPDAEEWFQVAGKPHLWTNRKGQMKYTPPEPTQKYAYPWFFLPGKS